jgi:hypothetical protein
VVKKVCGDGTLSEGELQIENCAGVYIYERRIYYMDVERSPEFTEAETWWLCFWRTKILTVN